VAQYLLGPDAMLNQQGESTSTFRVDRSKEFFPSPCSSNHHVKFVSDSMNMTDIPESESLGSSEYSTSLRSLFGHNRCYQVTGGVRRQYPIEGQYSDYSLHGSDPASDGNYQLTKVSKRNVVGDQAERGPRPGRLSSRLYPRLKYEWIGLLMSSTLYLLSGWDGMVYCRQESYSDTSQLQLFYDDDNDGQSYYESCGQIFSRQVLPSALITMSCASLALVELHKRHVSSHVVGILSVVALSSCLFTIFSMILVPQATHSFQNDLNEWAIKNNIASQASTTTSVNIANNNSNGVNTDTFYYATDDNIVDDEKKDYFLNSTNSSDYTLNEDQDLDEDRSNDYQYDDSRLENDKSQYYYYETNNDQYYALEQNDDSYRRRIQVTSQLQTSVRSNKEVTEAQNPAFKSQETSNSSPFETFFFHSPSLPKALYAINALGEIGANANLYHAIWVSFILTVALAHQYLYPLWLFFLCRSYLFWKKSRARRQQFFRHRERVGSWFAVFISSMLVFVSSSIIWWDVFRDICREFQLGNLIQYSQFTSRTYEGHESFYSNDGSFNFLSIHPRVCSSTEVAMWMGPIGAILSVFAVGIHSSSQRFAAGSTLLSLEATVSAIIVIVYGFGSMYVTGSYMGGLAESVGNVYYATWVAFLFSLRVFIGCMEEALSPDDKDESNSQLGVQRSISDDKQKPLVEDENKSQGKKKEDSDSRKACLKRWCALALLSAINHGAAYDAAQQMYYTTYGYDTARLDVMVESYGEMDDAQKFALVCPFFVMSLSAYVSLMHLWDETYAVISNPTIGLICALIAFFSCMAQIICSQHAANSFAINHTGEIVCANLYYFTWASMIVAGLNLHFYSDRRFHLPEKPLSFVMWFGLVKIAAIMVSSSSHIWLSIRADCRNSSNSIVDSSFCSRTLFALITGLLVTIHSSIVCAAILLKFKHNQKFQDMVSCILALMMLFAVGRITGIGGPAESVGDLYYSTWLAFFTVAYIAGQFAKRQWIERAQRAASPPIEPTPPNLV